MDPHNLTYPDFTLDVYGSLLSQLAERWKIVQVADAAGGRVGAGSLILRHDVDFSPALALAMAEVEHELGVRSTYFIALHLHYNPHTPLHANALKRMVELEHEIGLHYDSSIYDAASSPAGQLAMLRQHVAVLQDISHTRIKSIARHNPSVASGQDPFANGTPYVNAYAPALFSDTLYLSDSCRAWRNGGLSLCWQEQAPPRVYLLIHPELWSDRPAVARLAYLPLLQERVQLEQADFFAEVRRIWERHVGGIEHDQRTLL